MQHSCLYVRHVGCAVVVCGQGAMSWSAESYFRALTLLAAAHCETEGFEAALSLVCV